MGIFDSAVGAIGSSLIGGGLSYLGQSSANEANMQMAQQATAASMEEAQRNRDFQERMSNTTYQRAVADLRAAGLNPMMAYGNIHTAVPSGSVGVAQQATMQNTMGQAGQQVGDAVGKGAEVAFKMASVRNLQEQNEQIQATTARERSQVDLNNSAALKNEVDALQGLAMTDYYKKLQAVPSAQVAHYAAQIGQLGELTKAERLMNVGRGAESRMYERTGGEAIPYVKGVLPAVSSAVGGSVIGSILGGKFKWGRK